MKVYTYLQAKENLAEILAMAKKQEVFIRLKKGETYSVTLAKTKKISPLDIQGVNTKATTRDILDAVREIREGIPSSRS